VVETVNDAVLSVSEDCSEQYMDVDLTEYSSSSQPAAVEQSSLSLEQQSLQKPVAEVRPHESADQSVNVADRVDLPEGLCCHSSYCECKIATCY